MHDHIEAVVLGDDGIDGRVYGGFRREVERDGSEIPAVLAGLGFRPRDAVLIVAIRFPH
ncbi:hypothetical protein ACVWWG_007110 [Bradyrhizobium sp. LB7.2]